MAPTLAAGDKKNNNEMAVSRKISGGLLAHDDNMGCSAAMRTVRGALSKSAMVNRYDEALGIGQPHYIGATSVPGCKS